MSRKIILCIDLQVTYIMHICKAENSPSSFLLVEHIFVQIVIAFVECRFKSVHQFQCIEMWLCVCVCMCVHACVLVIKRERESVCVCVCVCVFTQNIQVLVLYVSRLFSTFERERERESDHFRERDSTVV